MLKIHAVLPVHLNGLRIQLAVGFLHCNSTLFNALLAIQGELLSFFAREREEGAKIVKRPEHEHLLGLITSVLAWMNDALSESSNSINSFDTKIDIFEGQKILTELNRLGLTAKSVNHYLVELELIEEAFRKISKEKQEFRPAKLNKESSEEHELCLSSGACRLLGGFLLALKNIFDEASENISAFRLVKYETMKYGKTFGTFWYW
jgi:hypothetical protein